MYNKIELTNNWEPFVVTHDGTEYNIPSGSFESEENLWNFIKSQSLKWGLDVVVKSRPEAPTVKQIKENKIVQTKVEEKVEENKDKKSKK